VAESEDWSDVAIVVKVGDEDKKGQLKIVGTEGSKAFQVAHWAPMQPPLMRMAPVSSKADAKDGDLAGVSMDDYSGKEKLKAAKSLAVDLDVEARLSGCQWAGVHTTAKVEHLCPQGRNPDKDGYAFAGAVQLFQWKEVRCSPNRTEQALVRSGVGAALLSGGAHSAGGWTQTV
jgi:hypothetical protein